ncbi:hypothetical protein HLB44_14045 [Aquincola sp. S2]|uniref:Uncharacterized protein n=1 Tax=Pseudaquabacterium terrae TaxID=2732868 RepID=A0ABX2EHN6_9BURK|nr:hypothetical protein [Aquabacterium terrae]NRF68110.1 hypothetical protein [Aquabacterium terrae]
MFELLLAALVLIACLVMLVRMALPERQQDRLDAFGRRCWAVLRYRSLSLWHTLRAFGRRSSPKARQDAARTAEDLIRRAREGKRTGKGKGNGNDADKVDGEWDGNVYRPKSFKPPRKPH